MTTTISPNLPVSFSTYRTIRIHPTVALARSLAIAPIVRANWALDAPDANDATLELAKEVIKLRQRYVNAAMGGLYDYGYVGFEQFLDDKGMLVLKPLLADSVQIVVDDNGEFVGIEVASTFIGTSGITGSAVKLSKEESVFMGLDVEAGFFYGDPLLEVARDSYDEWITANEGATRYDQKIAGQSVVVHYPKGQSIDADGNTTDNAEIAEELLASLEASGSIAIQDNNQELPPNSPLPGPDWRVEYIGDTNTRQGSFIERMRYLDNLLVRSFGLPERAVLEGQFGTKAESQSQKDFALEAIESIHEFVTEEFETQVLKPHLEFMLGSDAADTVNLIAGPISTDELAYKQKIAFEIIKANPSVIDLQALLDEVSITKAEQEIVETVQEEVETVKGNADNTDIPEIGDND